LRLVLSKPGLKGPVIGAKVKTGHTANIFCARFLTDRSAVSSSRDTQIRVVDLERATATRVFADHRKAVQKLTTDSSCPSVFRSCAEDGTCREYDLRESASSGTKLVAWDAQMFSMASTAARPELFVIGGEQDAVCLYDRRKLGTRKDPMHVRPLAQFAFGRPPRLRQRQVVTGVDMSRDGRRIVGSYMSGPLCIFDVSELDEATPVQFPFAPAKRTASEALESPPRRDTANSGASMHQPAMTCVGHINTRTIKEGRFVGMNDQYVASGSDNRSLIIWNRQGSIVFAGSEADCMTVNCISQSPICPDIATSGLDNDVKVWRPHRDKPVGKNDVLRCVGNLSLDSGGSVSELMDSESSEEGSFSVFSSDGESSPEFVLG